MVTPERYHPDRTPGFSIVHFLKGKLILHFEVKLTGFGQHERG